MWVYVKDIKLWVDNHAGNIINSAEEYQEIFNKCVQKENDQIIFNPEPFNDLRNYRMFGNSLYKTGHRCQVTLNKNNQFVITITNGSNEIVYDYILQPQ